MMSNFLKSIRISQKLVLISLSFLLPIAVLLYFMVAGINYDIRFTQLELYGNEYQRPLEELLDHITRHQLLQHRVAAGESALEADQLDEQAKIDQALQRLAAADAQYGVDLQFTEEGLGKRQRASANPRDLAAKWEQVKQSGEGQNPDVIDRRHQQLRSTVREMISHAGDTSNLILDPDLDSYYLMDITLLALPQTQDRLADIRSNGRAILAKPELTSDDKLQLAVSASLLRESDFDRIVASTRTALNEDANFYGISSSMRNVEQSLTEYMSATNGLLDVLTAAATADAAAATSVDQFDAAVENAVEASFSLWDTAAGELDTLLNTRVAHYRQQRLLALMLTAVALAASAFLVYVVARSITKPLDQCVHGLQKLAARDLTYRLGFDSRGELGEIAAAVDQAAEGMREAIVSLRESATQLQQAAEGQSDASQQMSANAEQTSTQANVVSTAAEKVSRNAQAVAVAVDELSASIREIASNAQEAAKVATEAVQLASNTNATVTKLGQSSAEIGEVLKVITSIAEQTNLLALNATIEAARAGEAGKGFAVVANAVKELAKETGKATEDISQKIDATQHDIQEAVEGIGRISHIIEQINDYQNSIAGAVEEQTVVTKEISTNVSGAARGTAEIADNITAVARAAESTAEGAAGTRQAAENSTHLASQLQSLVQQFNS